jgi:hemoglobin/transferrin/lactoferrin receptor protein
MYIKCFQPRKVALMVSALCFSSLILAEESTAEVERIAVWSTSVNASSMYLKEEAIANKQADHISDLLRIIPGVDVGGAHSLNQRITIRSMDDKDLNITIDGAKQNTYMYHHMGNLQIHADILKSVDIDVGTNSVLSSGLGGAVRFETKQARELLADGESLGGRIQVSSGENSGSNYSITGYGQLSEEVDFLAYYNAVERNNYKVGGGKIKDSEGNTIEGTDGNVRGLKGDLDDFLIKLGWNFADNQRLQLSFETYKDQGDYSYRPDMGLATDLAITNSLNVPLLWPTEFTRDTLTLGYEISVGNTLIKAAAYANTSELYRDESGWADNPAYAAWAAQVSGEATNEGFNVIAETAFDGEISHELVYGIDAVNHETSYNAKYSSATDFSEEGTDNLAFFAQDRIELTDTVTLVPGARYDDYDIDSAVVNDDFSEVSFSLALEIQATKNLLFKLSGTELFKGPEIGEVFIGAGLSDIENTDIKAETGVNVEFSFAYQAELSNTAQLSVGATVFNTDIENYIYDYATAPAETGARYWKDNIGDMEVKGYEAYINYSIADFDAAVTFSDAESDLNAFADYASLDGARLDRQQGNTISANLGYFFSSLNISVDWELLSVSSVDAGLDLDGATLNNAKGSYKVHNLSARWEPNAIEGMTLIVGVDNLFDEFYASQSSRTGVSFHPRFGELYLLDYEPGRNVKATISYSF